MRNSTGVVFALPSLGLILNGLVDITVKYDNFVLGVAEVHDVSSACVDMLSIRAGCSKYFTNTTSSIPHSVRYAIVEV